MKKKTTKSSLRVGLVVPHIFMHREILPHVIFSPADLARNLAEGLRRLGAEVTLFSPGPVDISAPNITADLSYFEQELRGRGDTYLDLLKKHPFTFVTLSRQVQSEVLARAFDMANRDELDIVHVYTNEEDLALPFAKLCTKPVVFTHHDPFNFLIKYKNVFPKYASGNWLSMSLAQRTGMPADTNWVGNIYHGLDASALQPSYAPTGEYIAYLGRVIQPKGVHLAIAAVKKYNETAGRKLTLKIAGKHYAGHKKDTYWQEKVLPELDDPHIEYVGFIDSAADKQTFLGNAVAAIVPSLFEEPFGMVLIEALACGTPIIGLDSGSIPEIIKDDQTGFLVEKAMSHNTNGVVVDEDATAMRLAQALSRASEIDRRACRQDFEVRFTIARMCQEHLAVYRRLCEASHL
jgi:glycosyltransferase involved in cell wall biosynthesis